VSKAYFGKLPLKKILIIICILLNYLHSIFERSVFDKLQFRHCEKLYGKIEEGAG